VAVLNLGAISDTHGAIDLMYRVANEMVQRLGVKTIFHLGDTYRDAVRLAQAGFHVLMVPGLSCPEYHDHRVPKRLVESFDELKVGCAHAEKDLRAQQFAAAIVLTGHTHEARIELIGRSLFVNPGHLQDRVSRGERPSYGLIQISPTDVRAGIYETDHALRKQVIVERVYLG